MVAVHYCPDTTPSLMRDGMKYHLLWNVPNYIQLTCRQILSDRCDWPIRTHKRDTPSDPTYTYIHRIIWFLSSMNKLRDLIEHFAINQGRHVSWMLQRRVTNMCTLFKRNRSIELTRLHNIDYNVDWRNSVSPALAAINTAIKKTHTHNNNNK